MKKFCLTMIVLGSLLPGLVACVPASENVIEETAVPDTQEAAVQPTEAAPTAAAESIESAACASETGHIFQSEEGGYCFVYPEDYCWLPGQDALVNTFVSVDSDNAETNRCPDEPLILHGDVVWISINVAQANGQSLDEAVASVTAGLEDFGLEMESVVLAGETAVQINNMPGQDISRELLTLHNGQLYRFTFVPAGADALYQQVTSTFQFLP
ncbi:MAG: hypothetical protein H6656_14820 [Ardenticatenaceae bacterium]|nr:hypothetical protein [Ardenticatenaceae bacterium]